MAKSRSSNQEKKLLQVQNMQLRAMNKEKQQTQNELAKKDKLFLEFREIETIAEKFTFWEKKLKRNYMSFLFANSAYAPKPSPKTEFIYQLSKFIIYPNTAQFQEYSNLFIEQYIKFLPGANPRIDLFDIEDLKDLFNNEKENSLYVDVFLNSTIRNIENWVKNKALEIRINPSDKISFFSLLGYDKTIQGNLQAIADLSGYDYVHFVYYLNGVTIALYHKFLLRELSIDKKNKTTKDKKGLTLKEKLLVLYFSGLLDNIDVFGTDTKKAFFLNAVTDEDEQNLRAELGKKDTLYYAKEKSKKPYVEKSLERVLQVFEKLENASAINAIKKKLVELNK